MVAPSGDCGVHSRPNAGQSAGFRRPWRIRPATHCSGSAGSMSVTANFRSASQAAYASRSRKPLAGMTPMPRHLRLHTSYTWSTTARAAGLPSGSTARP